MLKALIYNTLLRAPLEEMTDQVGHDEVEAVAGHEKGVKRAREW